MKRRSFIKRRRTICVDFDGVLHSYDTWNGVGCITGVASEGSVEAMKRLDQKYRIIILTCRADSEQGIEAVSNALKQWEIPYHTITNIKPIADYYIDDLAIRFTTWKDTMKFIENDTSVNR